MGIRDFASKHRFDCEFEGYRLTGDTLKKGARSWPVAGASADIELGAHRKGLTASRVVLAGPFSLLLKKDKSKIYVGIELANGDPILIEAKTKEEGKARKFIHNLNQASKVFSA